MSDFKYLFQDKYQNQFGGITFTAFTDLLKTLNEKYYVSSIQIIESASFSLAMVIRSHLGLSAEGGKIGIIAKDNLAGSLALAAARRLYNAGTNSTIIIPQKELGTLSKDFQLQAEAVSALGLELLVIDPKENEDSLNELLDEIKDDNSPEVFANEFLISTIYKNLGNEDKEKQYQKLAQDHLNSFIELSSKTANQQ